MISTVVTNDQQTNRKLTELEISVGKLELEAISIVEDSKDYLKAIKILSEAIHLAPLYSSPYNNRAQVYRLLGDIPSALADLNQAIELSNDGLPLVKRQALCQRAWIYHKGGDDVSAFKDFDEAAKLGSADGKRMSVTCNPYAKLCNNIMQEMLDRLYYSHPTPS